jgi:hypothetical protein
VIRDREDGVVVTSDLGEGDVWWEGGVHDVINAGTSVRTFVEGVEWDMWKKEGGERSSEVGECEPLSLIALAWEMFDVGVEVARH